MLKVLISVIVSIVLLLALIVINVFQTASLLIYPVSPRAFRQFNRLCADRWWGACALFIEKVVRVKVVFSGDIVPPLESAIVTANHQAAADILVLLCFGYRKGRLGDLKWFVKDVLKYLPGIGWGMLFLDCLFVKRDWAVDGGSIDRTFAQLRSRRNPVWLATFPEGTRLTPEKLERSRAYARKHGLPIPKRVMVPRTKGFVASTRGLSGHLDAIYDLTIGYLGAPPSLPNFVLGRAKEVHVNVRRTSVEDLPSTEEGLSGWLLDRFREKEGLLDALDSAQSFPGGAQDDPMRLRYWMRLNDRVYRRTTSA